MEKFIFTNINENTYPRYEIQNEKVYCLVGNDKKIEYPDDKIGLYFSTSKDGDTVHKYGFVKEVFNKFNFDREEYLKHGFTDIAEELVFLTVNKKYIDYLNTILHCSLTKKASQLQQIIIDDVNTINVKIEG